MVKKGLRSLNENEQKLYQLIKRNPYISQQELAASLGLSRPTIANLISGMMKKGFIIGKAYVLNETQQIICIGGANVDRKYYVKGALQSATSNPVSSKQSVGGVARNIAENLGRLGMDVALMTASGSDSEWSFIEEVSEPYMSLKYCSQFIDQSTGTYTAVLNDRGDMLIAYADMDVYDQITPEFILNYTASLSQARCIIVDLNCPKDSIETLCEFARTHDIDIVLVAVSGPKMDRMPKEMQGITWLITNRDETEAYFNEPIQDEEDWKRACEKWLELGLANIVITNGEKGAMIGNKTEGVKWIASKRPEKVVDVTGAGDAFSAAVIYQWLQQKTLDEIGKAAVINATKTLESAYTVRQDLSVVNLQKELEE